MWKPPLEIASAASWVVPCHKNISLISASTFSVEMQSSASKSSSSAVVKAWPLSTLPSSSFGGLHRQVVTWRGEVPTCWWCTSQTKLRTCSVWPPPPPTLQSTSTVSPGAAFDTKGQVAVSVVSAGFHPFTPFARQVPKRSRSASTWLPRRSRARSWPFLLPQSWSFHSQLKCRVAMLPWSWPPAPGSSKQSSEFLSRSCWATRKSSTRPPGPRADTHVASCLDCTNCLNSLYLFHISESSTRHASAIFGPCFVAVPVTSCWRSARVDGRTLTCCTKESWRGFRWQFIQYTGSSMWKGVVAAARRATASSPENTRE
mmetsp:Transcript_25136/g.72433  ORF Transcript_25136/g.72433 Transcript_25136/m.72433 type:complete len:316 (+) Transcript_25136:562-1509(+)